MSASYCSRARSLELVFPDPLKAKPLDKAAILRRFRKALTAAKLGKHTFQDLRHTFGTAMAAAGMPMRTLRDWMSHADIRTTMLLSHYAPRARDAELVALAFSREASQAESITSASTT